MKKYLFSGLLAFVPLLVFAQKNIVKGRLVGLPLGGRVFSIGAGYERFLSQQVSVQILLNRTGWDMRETDGSAEFRTSVAPEVRCYFRERAKVGKSAFFALFAEFQDVGRYAGGEGTYCDPGPCPSPFEVKSLRRDFNQGFLLGQNIRLSRRWHLETYAGPRFRSMKRKVNYDDGSKRTFRDTRWGVRVGANAAFRF